MDDMLRVGVISSTHGVRGEVKVYPTTDDANRFKKLKTVILDLGRGEQITLNIESVKFFKNMVILKFKERLASIFPLKSKNYEEIQRLSNLRDWLLPMLMNGQATIED